MKTIWVNQNKYIRLRISEVGFDYRADISINKYFYDERQEKYYEINFGVFSPYDFCSKQEAFESAKKWLVKELNTLQKKVNIVEVK